MDSKPGINTYEPKEKTIKNNKLWAYIHL